MNRFTTSSGDFQLTRFPEDPREQLRAWDAADEYLLRHLHGDRPQPDEGAEAAPVELRGTVVVLGDRWGALSTVLAASRPEAELVQLGDSYLAQQATRANLARAGLAPDAVRLLAGTETPRRASTCCWSGSPRAWPCWRTSCTGWPPPCTRGRWWSAPAW